MVADENFFVTVLKNSPMCHTHENRNLVHVQFDQWEQDKETKDDAAADAAAAAAAAALGRGRPRRNAAKCLMPNPDHCGRSPTINTLETLPALQLSEKPFARKFDADIDADVLDAIDAMRRDEESGKEGDGDGGSGSRRAYGNESGSGSASRDGGAGGLVFRDVRIAIETSTGGGGGGGPSRLCVHVPASSMDPAFVGRCGKGTKATKSTTTTMAKTARRSPTTAPTTTRRLGRGMWARAAWTARWRSSTGGRCASRRGASAGLSAPCGRARRGPLPGP